MATLEASWVLNHANPSFLWISFLKKGILYEYIICNMQWRDWLIKYSLNKKRKKTFRLLVLCIKIKFTMDPLQ